MPQPRDETALPIHIRDAAPDDAEAILDLIGQLARHHGDEPKLTLTGLRRDLFGPDPWSHAIVAEHRSQAMALVVLERRYRANVGERGLEVTNLFVCEAIRGRGDGIKLMEAAIAAAQQWGGTFVTVGAHPENRPAHRLYLKLGFRQRQAHGPHFRIDV